VTGVSASTLQNIALVHFGGIDMRYHIITNHKNTRTRIMCIHCVNLRY
jgi:hypothetical protein